MGTALSRVWDVLYFISFADLVAVEREYVHAQDYGVCFSVMPHYRNSNSLESPLDALVVGGYIILTGR